MEHNPTDDRPYDVISVADLMARKPASAKTAIVAEYVEDESDGMTDYYHTRTTRTVFLAWSSHERDVFSEMRKAADLFDLTAHLGAGKGRYTVSVRASQDINTGNGMLWKDGRSHWHRDLFGDDGWESREFSTRADAEAWIASLPAHEPHAISFDGVEAAFHWEIDGSDKAIEHREKYSMGHGYYLKASGRYSSGWEVHKVGLWRLDEAWNREQQIGIVRRASPAFAVHAPVQATNRASITANVERSGLEIRFPSKPDDATIAQLKTAGWRWTRFGSCWWRKDTPDARLSAASIVDTPIQPSSPSALISAAAEAVERFGDDELERHQLHKHVFEPAGLLRVCACGTVEE